jgi:hypothetical protein
MDIAATARALINIDASEGEHKKLENYHKCCELVIPHLKIAMLIMEEELKQLGSESTHNHKASMVVKRQYIQWLTLEKRHFNTANQVKQGFELALDCILEEHRTAINRLLNLGIGKNKRMEEHSYRRLREAEFCHKSNVMVKTCQTWRSD